MPLPILPTVAATRRGILGLLIGLLAALLLATPASAQWAVESYPLVSGWNAIWLPLDASYTPIDTVLPQTAIEEVWRWSPLDSTTQFTTSPSSPTQPDVQWSVWRRGDTANSTFFNLTGNAAYLVKVATGAAPLTASIKGRPLPPSQTWKSSGLNFAGFPVSGTPSFTRFLSYSADLKSGPPIFSYPGGPLSDVSPRNPAAVVSPGIQTMTRGQAYWVQSSSYSAYYGPLRVTISGAQMVDFGDTVNTALVKIKNVIDPAANLPVSFTLTPTASASEPAGQPAVAGPVPLRLRGDLDPVAGGFSYSTFSGPVTRTLAPGEEMQLVIAVERGAMGGTPGAVFQSLLRLTDSLNLTSIDLPVRAVSTSFAGVWTGGASVTNVDEVLSRSTVVSTADTQPTQPLAPFPVRLIMHASDSGSQLLPQVFVGNANGVIKASTREVAITGIANGRVARLTTASFPIEMQAVSGAALGPNSTVQYQVVLPFNGRSNPFVHAYHPDHDNLDERFERPLANKGESYTVTRDIKLTFQPTLAGVSATDPTWGSTTLGGTYAETITGLRKEPIKISGIFVIHRVAAVSSLLP